MATTTLQSTLSEDLQVRIDDYLNDKLQTSTDVDSVALLLEDVRNRQALLREQLEEANSTLEKARQASQHHAARLQQKAAEFQQHQDGIDSILVDLTSSTRSDEAVKMFEASMGKLHRLEIANGYMELIQKVNKINSDARVNVESDPAAAVALYKRLHSVTGAVKAAQPAAEGAAPHLVDQVERETISLYELLKNHFAASFQKTLEEMRWPQKDMVVSDTILDRGTNQANLLLALQEPDLIRRSEHTDDGNLAQCAVPVLLPLDTMVQPLVLRFRYHFYGEKPTNRVDKPEYFLSHFSDILEQHSRFVSELFQPLLDQRTDVVEVDNAIYTDAVSSFITALLPMVSAKCLSLLPQIETQPQLLSHFIHELMSFDSTLRNSWAYMPTAESIAEWKGLTWSMLTEHGYFDRWLAAEQQFALSRYRAIRDSPESSELDMESTGPQSTKPTRGAIRVNDLLETVTDRYKTLVSFSQKLKFLIDIQLAIFDDYHGHLHDGLQAYLMTSHTAGRLIQGQGVADQGAFSLKGIESLSRIFGSSEYLEKKMSDWSDDVFFLELWEDLQDRARRNTGFNGAIGRDLKINEVASKTSATIAAGGDEMALDNDGGALFDETAASFRRLRQRTEEQLVRAIDVNVRGSLRPFLGMGGYASLASGMINATDLSPSASLDTLLQTISSLLGYLHTVLAPAPLRRIARQACHAIGKEIWDQIVQRHSFSVAGAAQLRRDVSAIENAIDSGIRVPGEASRGLQRLEDALVLLGLPIRASGNDANGQPGDNAGDWGFEEHDEDDSEENDALDADDEKVWGLWEVEKRLNRSNEAARQVLSAMGLTQLNEKEARGIINRRVEVNS